MPVPFKYPDPGWSTGTMRKVAMKKGPAPDLAEMERSAGVGLTARGGSTARSEVSKGARGLDPDVIQQQKSATQAHGQQYGIGTKMTKKHKEGDLESLGLFEAIDTMGIPVEAITGRAPSEWTQKVLEQASSLQAKYAKSKGWTEIGGLDENLNNKQIPMGEWDAGEQAARTMKIIGQRYSISIGKKKPAEAEQEFEE